MRIVTIALLASATLVAAPALADETWKTEMGKVIWEKDYEGGAIFMIQMPQNKVARFYIEGLKPTDQARGSYTGYYINQVDENMCSAEITGPDGTKSRTWGRLEISFLKKGFPSDWVMKTGECMGETNELLVGIASK